MAKEKVMVCGGFTINNEKDCVAFGGEWNSDKNVCVGSTIKNENDCVAFGGRWVDEEDLLLVGVGASEGEVVATVRVVDGDETKMAKVASGEVLVGERFTPKHNQYLAKAAAIITDTGGKLSHGGVAGKMYNIPAVAGTVDATKQLKDGQKVVVDGKRGLVLKVPSGMEMEEKPKPKPAAGPSLADRMAAVAAKNKIELPPGFTEKQKEKE